MKKQHALTHCTVGRSPTRKAMPMSLTTTALSRVIGGEVVHPDPVPSDDTGKPG
jgi:hypothetical protein